jgi:hypothetical protein
MADHISKSFEEMDLTLQDSMLRRQALIAALEGVVKNCNLDFEKDTARTVEVKLAAMKTLDDLYKGQENVSMAKVKLALSRVDTKTNQNISAVAVEMLKRIEMAESGNYVNVNAGQYVDDDTRLESRAKELGIETKAEEKEAVVVHDQAELDQQLGKSVSNNEFDIEEG